MGALTLKSFPFELRGWDVEQFESIDPTDGFGSNVRAYVNNDQIIQIEPDYDSYTSNIWLTDKGRQFFDGIFIHKNLSTTVSEIEWLKLFENVTQNLYIFNICTNQLLQKHFFTIVFQNISLEVLSFLNILIQKYSFLKIRRAENIKVNNDLESNFQLNLVSDKSKLNSSDICLLISTNSRYQGYCLNLNLRQRFFKGNFKCLIVGSLIDITFPLSYLGSDIKVLENIIKGNHLTCRDLIGAENPTFIINDDLLKRNDEFIYSLNFLKNLTIFKKNLLNLNILNSSINSTGNTSLTNFLPFNLKDLVNFNSLHFINTNFNQFSNLKKIIKLKLFNFIWDNDKKLQINKLIIDQKVTKDLNTSIFYDYDYFYLPTNTFFENNDSFINTQGFIKRTNKIIFDKKNKSNWQILKKFLKIFQKESNIFFLKDSQIINFEPKNQLKFKNYINFQYNACQNLTNISHYLNVRNNFFFIKTKKFKLLNKKVFNTKFKYWLDDFFTGGYDDYSHKSLILINCSKIIRNENTNFF